jgi:hypothetical protein
MKGHTMIDLIERLRSPNASAGDLCDLADEAADAIERLTAERDSARRDGMQAAASLLDAEHDKRSHIDNHAAYYARMIREAIGR